MKRALLTAVTAVATGVAGDSSACGACIEDRIAATYDHKVVSAAVAHHLQVVFVGIDGPVVIARLNARIASAAPKIRGVLAGTLRTATVPPAFSFVLAADVTPQTAVADFRKTVGDGNARFTLLRIVHDGTLVDPD